MYRRNGMKMSPQRGGYKRGTNGRLAGWRQNKTDARYGGEVARGKAWHTVCRSAHRYRAGRLVTTAFLVSGGYLSSFLREVSELTLLLFSLHL
jgi:hypothetical protein